MKQLLLGIILGMSIIASAAWAGHYLGHDQGLDDLNRMQQQQERFNNSWERQQQEQFRMEQRLRPPC